MLLPYVSVQIMCKVFLLSVNIWLHSGGIFEASVKMGLCDWENDRMRIISAPDINMCNTVIKDLMC